MRVGPYRMRATILAPVLAVALGVTAAVCQQAETSTDQGITYVIPIRDETSQIDVGTSQFVQRAVKKAEQDGARAIIVDINTFGGRVDSATEIKDALVTTNIKTIAYVNKRAISAGALIALSCRNIVMAPGSSMGAATPVMIGPGMAQPLPTSEKEMSFVRSEFRTTAELNNYPPLLAEAMVDPNRAVGVRFTADGPELFEIEMPAPPEDSKPEEPTLPKSPLPIELPGVAPQEANLRYLWAAVPIGELGPDEKVVSKRGELLTLTADEAQLWGLTSYIADSIQDVMNEFGLQDTRMVYARITWSERLAGFLTNPIVSGLLLTFGFLGIIYELKMPGWGVSGTVGLICLALFFGANYLAGLASRFDIILFVIGVGLLAAEVLVIPGFGIAGISGIVCIVVSLYLALVPQPWPQNPWQMADVNHALLTLVIAAVMFVILLALTWKVIARTPLYPAIVQMQEERAEAGYTMPSAELQHLLDEEGIALTTLRPAGRARLADKTHAVMTEGDFIPKGTRVRVIEVKGNRIVVVRADDEPPGALPAGERT